jgi:hypothetical protein
LAYKNGTNNRSLLAIMEEFEAKIKVHHEEMMAKLDAHHERIKASVMAWQKETTACQEATGAYPEKLEAKPEEMEFGAEHWEVPKEHAAVKPVGGLRKQHSGWNLAIEHRQKLKEGTRGNGRSRKKLAASCRRMTHHAGVAQHKGHIVRNNQTRDKRADVREEMLAESRKGQGNKGPRLEEATISEEQENIWENL